MAADTASRMLAAATPNTPKACLAIDAPIVSAGPPMAVDRVHVPRRGAKRAAASPSVRGSLGSLQPPARGAIWLSCRGRPLLRRTRPIGGGSCRGDRGFAHQRCLRGRRLMHKPFDPNTYDAATRRRPLNVWSLTRFVIFC